jgi:hypothetical protein
MSNTDPTKNQMMVLAKGKQFLFLIIGHTESKNVWNSRW